MGFKYLIYFSFNNPFLLMNNELYPRDETPNFIFFLPLQRG